MYISFLTGSAIYLIVQNGMYSLVTQYVLKQSGYGMNLWFNAYRSKLLIASVNLNKTCFVTLGLGFIVAVIKFFSKATLCYTDLTINELYIACS